MDELESKLGYQFKDRTLLYTALSHSSFANENRSLVHESNERLEFLGDAVLGQVTAAYLFRTYPDMPEGQMTKLRAELVCEHGLHNVALQIELGKYIKLGRGEEHTGGRQRQSILADAVEALIAAMYIDGGPEVSKAFIDKYILSQAKIRVEHPLGDFKTELQELVQKTPGQALCYELISESGPDHAKTFTVRVSLNGKSVGQGTGRTKKEAEQLAAKCAIEEISK